MGKKLHLILAQINPVVGDLPGNAQKILSSWDEASLDADLVVFPELVLCGYPAEDLILKPVFIETLEKTLKDIIEASRNYKPAALITAPYRREGLIYNAAYLIENGTVKAVTLKHRLPNYDVFDEKRIFAAGPLPQPVPFRGWSLGVLICEDMWSEDVSAHLAGQGSDILIAPNASPYNLVSVRDRREQAKKRAQENNLPFVYVNQIGGQDELVFDGHSFIVNEKGDMLFSGAAFQENNYHVVLEKNEEGSWISHDSIITPALAHEEEIYSALMLGLRDYVRKNNFPGVLLGLSGGIDSALSAAIAVDALGADNVYCLMLPSQYTSDESLKDAKIVADNLGVKLDRISIEPTLTAFSEALEPFLAQGMPSTTLENIQPRTRGVMLMALSNAGGKMLLTTGNKSELAVGYATLYGDMCGGFNAIKDIYKTQVYALARWRNENIPDGALGPRGEIIPERVFTKAPTAELKEDQTDQDTLPPYETLDAILHGLIEDNLGIEDLVHKGYARDMVVRVWRLLDTAEYKRRQAAPGIKISPRAFGRDRRYPITNKFLNSIEKSGS